MKKILLIIITVTISITLSCAADNFRFSLPDVAEYKDVSVRFITAKDSIRLAYREAGSAASPIGLIFIPGSTMYGYYYIPLINELSKKNCLVRIIDIRGHGDSEGARGDVQSENDLIEDLSLHIKDLALKNPHMKIIIGGHSMGGGICGRYLEHYGYDAVTGVVYVAPFFHYKQPGMKNPGYVDVNIISFIFGGDHSVLQVYHPNSGDPKLVREYTNIMSKASMVSDFSSFRKNHNTPAVYVIGKDDELFDWEKSMEIFKKDNVKYMLLDKTGHLNYSSESLAQLGGLIESF